MDYYCTKSAVEILNRMTPNEIDDYMNMYDELPDDEVIITDGMDTAYIMSTGDFQEDSCIFGNNMMRIEYFEDGIPDYLLPKRGLTYYYCTWDGQWTFTEDYRK